MTLAENKTTTSAARTLVAQGRSAITVGNCRGGFAVYFKEAARFGAPVESGGRTS
jgi:hypothetical protein